MSHNTERAVTCPAVVTMKEDYAARGRKTHPDTHVERKQRASTRAVDRALVVTAIALAILISRVLVYSRSHVSNSNLYCVQEFTPRSGRDAPFYDRWDTGPSL
jgi:hypothetical protein